MLLIVLDAIVYLLIISSAINQISLIGFLEGEHNTVLTMQLFLTRTDFKLHFVLSFSHDLKAHSKLQHCSHYLCLFKYILINPKYVCIKTHTLASDFKLFTCFSEHLLFLLCHQVHLLLAERLPDSYEHIEQGCEALGKPRWKK